MRLPLAPSPWYCGTPREPAGNVALAETAAADAATPAAAQVATYAATRPCLIPLRPIPHPDPLIFIPQEHERAAA